MKLWTALIVALVGLASAREEVFRNGNLLRGSAGEEGPVTNLVGNIRKGAAATVAGAKAAGAATVNGVKAAGAAASRGVDNAAAAADRGIAATQAGVAAVGKSIKKGANKLANKAAAATADFKSAREEGPVTNLVGNIRKGAAATVAGAKAAGAATVNGVK